MSEGYVVSGYNIEMSRWAGGPANARDRVQEGGGWSRKVPERHAAILTTGRSGPPPNSISARRGSSMALNINHRRSLFDAGPGRCSLLNAVWLVTAPPRGWASAWRHQLINDVICFRAVCSSGNVASRWVATSI